MMNNDLIIKRFGMLVTDRKNVEQIWETIERFIVPYRGKFFKEEKNESSIEWNNRQIFDSTAPMAQQTLSASLHGDLTSPSSRWFDMRFRTNDLNKNVVAKEWLQKCSDRVFYELQDSNFNLEVNETYQDLTGFGTAMLLEEPVNDQMGADWEGVTFTSVPIKEGYFEQDHKGRPANFYRKLEWTPLEIITKFGDKNVPAKITELEAKGSTDKLDIVFCVYMRKTKPVEVGKRVAPAKRPYGYKYILLSGGEMIGKEGGYYEMPVYIPRWRKTSSSVWGNSPSHIALPDVLSLNELLEIRREAGTKAVDPPIFANSRSVLGDLDLDPGTLNVVRDITGIKAFEFRGRLDFARDDINDLRDNIRSYYFTDQLNYPQPQAQPMTATEAQIRYELMQRLLGPTLGRLQADLLNLIISRTFSLLARAGELGDVPDIVKQSSAGDIDIVYLGPLARAQKVDEVASIERWVMQGVNMSQVNPEVLDVIDFDEAQRETGLSLSVPAGIIRDEDAVKAVRKVRMEAAQRMQQAEISEQEGKANEALGKGEAAMQVAEGTA